MSVVSEAPMVLVEGSAPPRASAPLCQFFRADTRRPFSARVAKAVSPSVKRRRQMERSWVALAGARPSPSALRRRRCLRGRSGHSSELRPIPGGSVQAAVEKVKGQDLVQVGTVVHRFVLANKQHLSFRRLS